MLDVGALVDAEEAERLLVGNSVAFDQPFYLRAGDARELTLVSVKGAKASRVRLARKLAEGVDQRLRLRVQLLSAHAVLAFAEAAGEHHPESRVILLAGLDALLLGEVFGEHAPAVAVRAGAVNGADG